MQNIDAVFEGGGVKGSGLVGAIAVAEEKGYQFKNVAGTSAGAIIGALVAARYTSAEMKAIMDALDYQQFRDRGTLGSIPIIGPLANLVFKTGIFEGEFFYQWLKELLAKKGIRTFGDLVIDEFKDDPKFRYKLQVITSDVTRGQLLVLPGDAADFGIEPDTLEVARAVRMSMSIPYFYKPARMTTKNGVKVHLVDGALLSNYPLWLLDEPEKGVYQDWPTIGFRLVDPKADRPHKIRGPLTLFAALFSTMMEAHDARYIKDTDFMRTIPIPTLGVNTTEFDITPEFKELLYQSGLTAARDFFSRWNFEEYQKQVVEKEHAHRRKELWKE